MSATDALRAAFDEARFADEPHALLARRRQALEAFAALGIPNPRRDEEWKYTPTRALAKHEFVPAVAMGNPAQLVEQERLGSAAMTLTFIDGHFAPHHSTIDAPPAGVTVHRLGEAVEANASDVLGVMDRERGTYANGFGALHDAYAIDGVVIDVAADADPGVIQVLHLASEGGDPRHMGTTAVLRARRHSRVTLFESFAGSGGAPVLRTRAFHVQVDEGATVRHVTLQDESAGAFHIGEGDAQVDRDATYDSTVVSLGGTLARDTLTARIHHPGAHVALTALFAPVDGQTIDHHTAIDHRAPNCTSDQLYKGVLDGTGHGIFNGKIFVRQAAQQTAAEQMNRNLMLSRDARIDTKPQLEIFADDVRCTHGATIGQLDQDEMFYMMSRAIPRDAARRLLIQGFADEALERVDDEALRQHLSARVAARRG